MAPVALFVIDIQNDLARDPKTEIPHAARIREAGTTILESARERIDHARRNGEEAPLTIVFVQHAEPPEEGALVEGSKAWELVFNPREGDEAERLVAKTTRDTFESNPGLAEQLKKEGVERIVAFGIQSDACVRATCKGAMAAGFQVTLLKGAHSTYNTKEKSAEEIERQIERELVDGGVEVVVWSRTVI